MIQKTLKIIENESQKGDKSYPKLSKRDPLDWIGLERRYVTWYQKGAQIYQKGAKREPTYFKRAPKGSQWMPKGRQCNPQINPNQHKINAKNRRPDQDQTKTIMVLFPAPICLPFRDEKWLKKLWNKVIQTIFWQTRMFIVLWEAMIWSKFT